MNAKMFEIILSLLIGILEVNNIFLLRGRMDFTTPFHYPSRSYASTTSLMQKLCPFRSGGWGLIWGTSTISRSFVFGLPSSVNSLYWTTNRLRLPAFLTKVAGNQAPLKPSSSLETSTPSPVLNRNNALLFPSFFMMSQVAALDFKLCVMGNDFANVLKFTLWITQLSQIKKKTNVTIAYKT